MLLSDDWNHIPYTTIFRRFRRTKVLVIMNISFSSALDSTPLETTIRWGSKSNKFSKKRTCRIKLNVSSGTERIITSSISIKKDYRNDATQFKALISEPEKDVFAVKAYYSRKFI